MFIQFSEEAQQILKRSKKEMQKLKHPFVGSEHLILSILNSKNSVCFKLNEYGINYNNFKTELIKNIPIGQEENAYFIYTPLLKRVLENAIIDARERSIHEISVEMLFLSMLDESEGVAIRILNNLGVNIDELFMEISNKNASKASNKKKNNLLEFGIDLNKKALNKETDPLIGRDYEVNKVIEILLRRTKNNPLLIGEAGVGKTAIVEELAKRIVEKDVPEVLQNRHIISLSMASLVAGTKYRGEFEERITKMLKDIENNEEIIVFIDEIHTIVGAGGAEGAIDASNIIKPALARGKIRLIGATTISEYKETIENDKALNRRFQTILVKESTNEETKEILKKIKKLYEDYHHVSISDSIIDELVDLSNKYIYNRQNPDKAIDILDEVCAKVSLMKDKNILKLNALQKELEEIKDHKNNLIMQNCFENAYSLKNKELVLENKINNMNTLLMKKNNRHNISLKDVADVIEDKTGIPIYEINKDDKNIKDLEIYLKNTVIGQDNVIEALMHVTKKIKLGYKHNHNPYSMLFIGGSGVGKTYLVKEYSHYLNIPLIRLDMSEYKESHTISKIIGSPPGYVGYDSNNHVLEKIRNNPYSIILLDEIEKASSEVINLFLQVLDEGLIKDSKGNEINFKNTMIIMTSNIGSNKNVIGFDKDNNNVVDNDLRDILSTEFVNRISEICYFNKLREKDIHKIVNKKIKEVKSNFIQNNVNISINQKFINKLIKESNYEIYGARKLNKLIETRLDNIVIDNILKGHKDITITE